VVAPISNDKILPSEASSSSVTGKKRPGQEETNQNISTTNQAPSPDENGVETSSVDVERANQIYSQSKAKLSSGEDPITNPEQARSLAAEIRVQIETNGQQALQAQTGAASTSLSALLEAAPV
jgi:hypothetical protein